MYIANLFLLFFYHGRIFVSVDPIYERALRSDSFLENFSQSLLRIYIARSRLDSFIIVSVYRRSAIVAQLSSFELKE